MSKLPFALARRLEWLLAEPVGKKLDLRTILWLAFALTASVYFASLALHQAFSSPYILQDDSRQHVFWTARFIDADLFPGDLIANYFQAIAPSGYAALYQLAARIGLDPFLFSKLLPMALGLATTIFCFAASMELFAVPSAAFISSLALNESLWLRNGLVSATPRAFSAPLFAAFIFFMLRGSAIWAIVAIGLMGLFFPSAMLVALGVFALRIIKFENRRFTLSRERRDYALCLLALIAAGLAVAPFAIKSASFGPIVTASEGRLMPEFLPKGRMAVFRQGFIDYWLTGSHTGMLPASLFSTAGICLGLLLPAIIFFPKRLPLVKSISGGIAIFPKIALASLALFFAANALLFRLYLPSRFTVNSFRILLALASGMSAIALLDAIFKWANRSPQSLARQAVALVSVAALGVAIVIPQAITGVWIDTRYKKGQSAPLYEFLSSQPKDALTASLSNEADNLPMFTRRPVLINREIALPFHKAYYSQIRQRAIDLINAQYSADISELQRFIQKYNVSFLLVDADAFAPEYLTRDRWLMQFQPEAKSVADKLRQGTIPALSKLTDQCSVMKTTDMTLVSAECILKAAGGDAAQASSISRLDK
jgi:hypothetical protein